MRGQCAALEAIGFVLGVPPRDVVLEIAWPDRHTALGGLLDGTLRFGWGRAHGGADESSSGLVMALWENNDEGTPEIGLTI